MSHRLALLLLAWCASLALCGVAAAAPRNLDSAGRADARAADKHEATAEVDRADAVRRAERRARRLANEKRFQNLSLARGGVAVAGFMIFGWGVWLRRRGRAELLRSLRLAVLALLAVASFAGYYNFFLVRHPVGFKSADVFHYYMGSRYFAELGYFELYHCTLAALIEDGLHDPSEVVKVRNQRTLRIQTAEETNQQVHSCPGRFDPARWELFKRDLAFFRPRILGGSWRHLLVDHGYNPTPVWAFVGGLFSERVAGDSDYFPALIQLDRLLAVLGFGLVLWAFGLEIACLVALVWGASPLWSYNWIGDAFLRNLWLVSTLAGLCLLKQMRPAASGVLLATAALLRIFPGIFVATYLAREIRSIAKQRGRPSAAAKRFCAGVAAGGLILIAAGGLGTGRGFGAYGDFAEKMSGLVAQTGVNKIGLSALAGDLVNRATTLRVVTPEGKEVRFERPAPFAVAAVRGVQLALVLLGLYALWRALPRLVGWEAAAAGSALIPLLTSPANYYYPFVLATALLALRRPWVGVALAATTTAWIVLGLTLFLNPLRYLAYDVVAVLFAIGLLLGLGFSQAPPSDGPARQTPTTA